MRAPHLCEIDAAGQFTAQPDQVVKRLVCCLLQQCGLQGMVKALGCVKRFGAGVDPAFKVLAVGGLKDPESLGILFAEKGQFHL